MAKKRPTGEPPKDRSKRDRGTPPTGGWGNPPVRIRFTPHQLRQIENLREAQGGTSMPDCLRRLIEAAHVAAFGTADPAAYSARKKP